MEIGIGQLHTPIGAQLVVVEINIVRSVIEIGHVQDADVEDASTNVFIVWQWIQIHQCTENPVRIFGSLVVPCWANRPLEDTEAYGKLYFR